MHQFELTDPVDQQKCYLNSKPTEDYQYQVIEHDFYNLEKRN